MHTSLEKQTLIPLTLTITACAYIQQKLSQRKAGKGVRLAIKSAGCSGSKYVFDYVDDPSAEDYSFPTQDENIQIYVDKKSYPFVKGTMIDFIEDKFNAHFVFDNPNVKHACGCGESFSIEDKI